MPARKEWMTLRYFVPIVLLVITLSSLLFLKPAVVKRYIAATLVVCILNTLLSELSVTYKLWEYPDKLFPGLATDIPVVYGAFLAATIWVLAYAYGHPVRYAVLNAISAVAMAYPLNWLFKYFDYYHLINYPKWLLILNSMFLAGIAYWVQMWQDGVMDHSQLKGSPLRSFRDIVAGGSNREPAR